MRTIQNLEIVFEREKQEPEQLFDFSCSILLLLFCCSFFLLVGVLAIQKTFLVIMTAKFWRKS